MTVQPCTTQCVCDASGVLRFWVEHVPQPWALLKNGTHTPHVALTSCCLAAQVCTGVMVHGYPMVKHLCGGMQEFMKKHRFNGILDFKGAALPYFTTHGDLVARQKAAIAERKSAKVGLANDQAWTGDGFVAEADSMVSNRG